MKLIVLMAIIISALGCVRTGADGAISSNEEDTSRTTQVWRLSDKDCEFIRIALLDVVSNGVNNLQLAHALKSYSSGSKVIHLIDVGAENRWPVSFRPAIPGYKIYTGEEIISETIALGVDLRYFSNLPPNEYMASPSIINFPDGKFIKLCLFNAKGINIAGGCDVLYHVNAATNEANFILAFDP